MNEEIIMRMGFDNSALSRGLRDAKTMAKDFKESFSLEGLKGFGESGLGMLGLGLGAAEIGEQVHKAMELAESIKHLSEEYGVSTTFLQQWNFAAEHTGSSAESAEKGLQKLTVKIGEARTGNDEAVQAFQKWGIALEDANGHVRSTQDILESVSKRMGEIEDPTQRNAMAFQLMGRSAADLTEALTNLDRLKQKSEGKILTEKEIEILDRAEHKAKSIGSTIKTWFGKATAFGLDVLSFGRLGEGDYGKTKEKPVTEASEAEIANAKKIAKLHEETTKARHEAIRAEMSNTARLFADKLKLEDLEKALNSSAAGSLQEAQLELDVEKQKKVVLDDQKKCNEDADRQKKQALEDQKKLQQEQLELQQKMFQLAQAQHSAARAKESYKNAFEDPTKMSFSELLASAKEHQGRGHWESGWGGKQWVSNMSEDEAKALQADKLDQSAKWNRQHHNFALSDEQHKQALDIMGSLGGVIKSGDADPLKSQREAMNKAEAHLNKLTSIITTKGLKVDVALDDDN